MKTKNFAVLLLLSGLFIALSSKGEVQKRSVSSFSEISLRISGVVYLEQGSPQSIEIEAKSSTLEKIITEVKDNKLVIKFEDNNYFWRNFNPEEIVIHIKVPEIDGLTISGSGDIIAKNGIKTKEMEMVVSGSGNIKLSELMAGTVKTNISGSGNINIDKGGSANDLSVTISGSGNVKAGGFEAKDVTVKVSGSGNSTVFATESLNVRVSGSGDVYYNGSPEINSSVAGSGSVKKIK
jgi:hypothetical protein